MTVLRGLVIACLLSLVPSGLFAGLFGSSGGGLTSPLTTNGDIWYFSGVDARLPVGTPGQCFIVNGSSLPDWGSCTGSAGITTLNLQTGATQTFANDANFTISSSANVHTLGWAGLLAVSRGGTGAASLTGLVLGNGTSPFSAYAGSSCSGQFVRSTNGSGVHICETVTTADVSTALRAHSKSVTLTNPTTALTNKIQWEFHSAVTITAISCSTDTGTVTIQLDERARATPNTAGSDVLSSALVCDNDTQASGSFSNASIATDVPVNLQITAASGSPTVVRMHVQYTID